jgi:hypothetical protein
MSEVRLSASRRRVSAFPVFIEALPASCWTADTNNKKADVIERPSGHPITSAYSATSLPGTAGLLFIQSSDDRNSVLVRPTDSSSWGNQLGS